MHIKTFPCIFDLDFQKNFPLFFTRRKLRPPGIKIKATGHSWSVQLSSVQFSCLALCAP